MKRGRKRSGNRYGVNSVDIAMTMLEAIAELRRPVSLSEVARHLHVSPGKVHRYFVSLVRSGMLVQQPETGKYELGPLSLRVGLSGLAQVDAVRFASEALPAFRDQVNRTVLLAVWSETGPVVVRMEESNDPLTMNMRVGSTLPVLTSAIGRVFLAYLPPGQTATLAAKEQRQKHSRRIDRVDDITRAVRTAGLARIDSYLLPDVVAAACPIFDHQGTPAAVVGILGLSRVDRFAVGGAAIAALRRFAVRVSERLGHRPVKGARS